MVALAKRFKELNPVAVRVTVFTGGKTHVEELLLMEEETKTQKWVTAAEAEPLLSLAKAKEEEGRLVDRAATRLGLQVKSSKDLKKEDLKVVLLSGAKWDVHPLNKEREKNLARRAHKKAPSPELESGESKDGSA